jgi:hypothetical protein
MTPCATASPPTSWRRVRICAPSRFSSGIARCARPRSTSTWRRRRSAGSRALWTPSPARRHRQPHDQNVRRAGRHGANVRRGGPGVPWCHDILSSPPRSQPCHCWPGTPRSSSTEPLWLHAASKTLRVDHGRKVILALPGAWLRTPPPARLAPAGALDRLSGGRSRPDATTRCRILDRQDVLARIYGQMARDLMCPGVELWGGR